MLFFEQVEAAANRQQARDIMATNIGMAGGKDATKAVRKLTEG